MREARWRVVAFALVVGLVAVGCQSDDGGDAGSGEPRSGGEVVLGVEQWPECINPVTSCFNASWTHWAFLVHVLPKAMTLDESNNYVPSPVLVEEPSEDNGGIANDPFRVTYKIAEEAVWDDGTPITSADFEFSWKAHMETTGSLVTAGYEKIESIDTSDPKTAVITFSEPYAPWRDLFGGGSNYILKKDAFPDGPNLEGKLAAEMPFSGGPWTLQSFSPQEAVLVRNDAFWGEAALLDKVTMVPREDQATEVNALLTGEIVAIYPQPTVTMRQQFEGANGVEFSVGAGTTYEALWPNHSKPPLGEKAVREALGYAVDREAVVESIVKPINPEAEVLNCAAWVPNVGPWCDGADYRAYSYDPDKAKSILTDAGWTMGSDGIFAKGGQRLAITFSTTSGNTGREDTQALLKEKAKAAGIQLDIQNFPGGELFQNKLPKLDFNLGEYAQVASPDPGITTIVACERIPTEANGFSGQNFVAWCNERATEISKRADATVDPEQRVRLVKELGDLIAQDVAWIPLYQKPLITAWRADRLDGPVGAFTQSPMGGFANMDRWYLAS